MKNGANTHPLPFQPRRVDSLLYKISKPGLPDSFLFGTIHSPLAHRPGISNFHPEKSKEFLNAEQVFVECINPYEYLDNKKQIRNYFSASQIEEIKAYLAKFNCDQIFDPTGLSVSSRLHYPDITEFEQLSIDQLFDAITTVWNDKMLPGLQNAIQSFLAVFINLNEKSYDFSYLDLVIVDHAKKLNKNLFELDTKSDILKMISEVTPELQVEQKKSIILAIIENTAYYEEEELNEVISNYVLSSLSLQQITLAYEMQSINHFDDAPNSFILAERNKKWIEIILPKLFLSSFIAVGASHLLNGPNCLLHLFEKAGFIVEPVECPRESLPYEIQFSQVTHELKSHANTILSKKFLKPLSVISHENASSSSSSAIHEKQPLLRKRKKSELEKLKSWHWEKPKRTKLK